MMVMANSQEMTEQLVETDKVLLEDK